MAVQRPTFSENWYRVAQLKPALRTVVQTYRQNYRGRMWHVLRDPSNNQFFRLDDAGYHFIGMLDGNRSVAQVWEACNQQLGDSAPTQGEAIQLLGQLFTSNLLQCEMTADSQSMFERYRKRIRREIGGYLMNLLFMRIPLFDPERILQRWVGLFRWCFSPVGMLAWLALLGIAVSQITGQWSQLSAGADPQLMLRPENLLLLYLGFGIIKVIHEFGHGFACKHFGLKGGTGGEVHTIGIMFLVMMPVPYVDASSSWAFRSKWHRAFVGAAGMYVELAVASIAAIIWANTAPGLLHDLCFNMMFIASVSTLLFNGNPLLRYDGYYILSDILEIPNLAQRGKEYFYYLIKKYLYRAQHPRNPAHTSGERFWLLAYAVTSSIYRVFISIAIMAYVITGLPKPLLFIGFIFAASAVFGWVVTPMFKWFKYLATHGEIARTRAWSTGITCVFLAAVIGFVGFFNYPDYMQAEGVVKPRQFHQIHMGADGKVDSFLESGSPVTPAGHPVLTAHNMELDAQIQILESQLQVAKIESKLARADGNIGLAQSQIDKMVAVQQQLTRIKRDIASLTIHAPVKGQWIAPNIERAKDTFIPRGEPVGIVASTEDLFIRAFAGQGVGPLIQPYINDYISKHGKQPTAQVRIKGRPADEFQATITRVLPAGTEQLPSAALGYVVGGSVQIDATQGDPSKAAEPGFEVRLDPKLDQAYKTALADWQTLANKAKSAGQREPTKPKPQQLRSGQRVIVRFELPSKPLAAQWWRSFSQLLQSRFQ